MPLKYGICSKKNEDINMLKKLLITFIFAALIVWSVSCSPNHSSLAAASPSSVSFLCPNGAKPFEGTGRGETEAKAREDANVDITNQFSTIRVNILDELIQKETSDDIKEYANYQRNIKIEGELYAGYVKDTEYPYRKEDSQFVAKRYMCPYDVAKLYLDSLENINKLISVEKRNGSFCETLYKTYNPKVMLFKRILERLGETDTIQTENYKRIEKEECSKVSFEEALTKAVAEISSKVQGKIVIAEIYASLDTVSGYITGELEDKLNKVKTLNAISHNLVESANISKKQKSKKSGQMADAEAVRIGKSFETKAVITGSFTSYAEFSQLRIKAINVQSTNMQTPEILAVYAEKIRPDDMVLASVMQSLGIDISKLPVVTREVIVYLNKGEDLYRAGKYDEAIRELDSALVINANLADGYFIRSNAYDAKGNHDQAIKDYNTVLEINPDYCDYDDGDLAIKDYNAALKFEPNDHQTLTSRGNAYYSNKEYVLAIEDYTAALKSKPNDHEILRHRGDAYKASGNYDKVIEDLEAILRSDPYNADARRALDFVRQKKAEAKK